MFDSRWAARSQQAGCSNPHALPVTRHLELAHPGRCCVGVTVTRRNPLPLREPRWGGSDCGAAEVSATTLGAESEACPSDGDDMAVVEQPVQVAATVGVVFKLHFLHGSDAKLILIHHTRFNPRPPCGGRPFSPPAGPFSPLFQSAPPVRGATPSRKARAPVVWSFNPRPPCGGRLSTPAGTTNPQGFNPRPPCGGRRVWVNDSLRHETFQSTPRAEGDLGTHLIEQSTQSLFQSTPPVRRATYPVRVKVREREQLFQSTPPVRRATTGRAGPAAPVRGVSIHAPRAEGDFAPEPKRRAGAVSIHAPRAEGDSRCGGGIGLGGDVSIHAPRAEGDGTSSASSRRGSRRFQSTPPVRRATGNARLGQRARGRVSIHAPRAEGDLALLHHLHHRRRFNPRPPCGGRLRNPGSGTEYWTGFNPRPPCGGRRGGVPIPGFLADVPVSIHAPRAEGDMCCHLICPPYQCFNPRPPCGGRHDNDYIQRRAEVSLFQSTPPVRRATRIPQALSRLRAGFNPRPPCGGRRDAYRRMGYRHVSIHAPRAEGDLARCPRRTRAAGGFNPRPPCGGRPAHPIRRRPCCPRRFNPRPPCGGRPP